MGRRKVVDSEVLKYEVKTRVNESKYLELERLIQGSVNLDMSGLVRDILYNRSISVITYDRTMDMTMEELSAIRGQIRKIGVNINQMTKLFNTYPEPRRKEIFARMAFQQYTLLQPPVEQLLGIISQLAKKWLQG
jgi:hypothetical protein